MTSTRMTAQRRSRRYLAVALIACLSASCQFLGLDMFPPELQGASVSCDLPALVQEKTGAIFKRVQTMRQVTAGSLMALFLICDTDSSNVLVILDPETLACLGCFMGTSMPIGASVEDHFGIGDKDFPNDGAWLYSTISASINSTSYRFMHPSKSDAMTILTRTGDGYLYMEGATSVSSVWSTIGTASAWIDAGHSTNWDLMDMALGSYVSRLLLRNNNTGMASYVEYQGSPASLYAALCTYSTSLLANVPPAFSFSSRSQEAWLLDDCVIHVDYNRSGRILRRSYKDGTVFDSHLIDPSWKESLYFEPTGERWYYYDTRVSRLCVLRTWW